MQLDLIGLHDTPPSRRQIRLGLAFVGMNVVVMTGVMLLPNVQQREITAVVPITDTITLLSDLVIATLLYVQASVFRSRALTFLASSFVSMALLLVTHLLTSPGAFAPNGLLGAGLGTTGWIALIRRAVYPAAVIIYVALRLREGSAEPDALRPDPRILSGLMSAILFSVLATLLVTAWQGLLPPLFVDRVHVIRTTLVICNLVLIALTIAAMLTLRLPRPSTLDTWLLVSLTSWLTLILLNTREWGRFTTGFYAQSALMPVAHLILMLALLAQASSLYARLALSTAARQRDRDARLISADAMAATFSHEIGQPLTAVTVNTLAGLSWLNRTQPNVGKAVEAMHNTLDAAKRTVSVTRSVRAMISRKPGTATMFDINELVRQTAALLQHELATAKIALHLHLDDGLPTVHADNVQIQQVLINLLMNAIESVVEARDKRRRITIRSILLDEGAALIEVGDNGTGIPPEERDRIFEPLVTTKATGSGLGLSICRTIVEQHGGRIWVSPDARSGATMMLRLPCWSAFA